jgi:Protein of unknown function (DUF2442)
MEKLVDVIEVEVLGEYVLRLTFEDGLVGDVSFVGREWRGVFEPFQDSAVFAQARVDSQFGTVVWPNGLDMAPETLYEKALQNPVREPFPATG